MNRPFTEGINTGLGAVATILATSSATIAYEVKTVYQGRIYFDNIIVIITGRSYQDRYRINARHGESVPSFIQMRKVVPATGLLPNRPQEAERRMCGGWSQHRV